MVECGALQHYHSNLSKVWNVSQYVWVGRQKEAFLTCKIMIGELYRKCTQKKGEQRKKTNRKQQTNGEKITVEKQTHNHVWH